MNNRRIRAAVKVTSRKISARRKKNADNSADIANYESYLRQAEVCREQAHDAVRLKRWKAACGLFSTAIALCNRAATLGGDTCLEAKDALRQMQSEMASYSELARSMDRPLLAMPTMASPTMASPKIASEKSDSSEPLRST